jgi:prophage tail gpP-like protein
MARFELRVGGEIYSGWKSLTVVRGLEQATSTFDLSVSEKWPLLETAKAWQIMPGNAAEIYLDDELLLTGYVDAYNPGYSATGHEIGCSGRSKTCDFVDSSITQTDGQFKKMTPGQIARMLAAPFGIEVVSDYDGEPVPDAQAEQGETCFAIVERLSRLQEILITDDQYGRLVLTRAGAGQCSTVLEQGVNILEASATHDDSERFSDYIVKAQRPGSTRTKDDWSHIQPIPPGVSPGARFAMERRAGAAKGTKPKTLTQIIGQTRDEGITRYRAHVIVAEAQADGADAQKRADWEMRRRLARSKEAQVTVNGWRQRDGRLWQQNENVYILSPWLDLAEPLLISEVEFSYSDAGEVVTLTLVLPDTFLPEPKRKTKADAKKKAGGDGGTWAHIIKDSGKT